MTLAFLLNGWSEDNRPKSCKRQNSSKNIFDEQERRQHDDMLPTD
jgi:hypothetical protein